MQLQLEHNFIYVSQGDLPSLVCPEEGWYSLASGFIGHKQRQHYSLKVLGHLASETKSAQCKFLQLAALGASSGGNCPSFCNTPFNHSGVFCFPLLVAPGMSCAKAEHLIFCEAFEALLIGLNNETPYVASRNLQATA